MRALIEELIYGASLRLDAGDYPGFISLCAPDFRYSITTFSPEIRKPMLWLEKDREGLQTLFETLPRHNSDHARLCRHVTLYTVAPRGDLHAAVSALQVFRTQLDGGASELFAVGKVHDTVRIDGTGALLVARRIELDTRMLGIGSHIPF